MDDSLAFAGLGELAVLLRRRDISPVELADFFIERIEQYDPAFNAYIEVTTERARAQAHAAERLMASGHFLGPLHGIPLAFKDLIDVEGLPTKGGSILRNEHIAKADAHVAQRLFQAGAVLLGKTHMVEFAFGGAGINHHYGTPWNPWDADVQRLPGGSSSGSGVAVAAGLAAAALGSDTGGSVRIPSSFCGLVGLKPTFGLVSNRGVLPLDPTLDCIGPLAHTVEDCALLHQAISGPDAANPHSLHHPPFAGVDGLDGDVKGLRLCFPREYFWSDVDEEVEAAVRASAQVFADLNVYVDEISLEVLDDLSTWRAGVSTTAVESYLYHRDNLENKLEQFDHIVSARMLDGRDIMAVDFLAQMRARDELRQKVLRAFETVDFLITPTTPFAAPPLREVDQGDAYFAVNGLCLRNTSAVNLLGLCAVSLPCGLTRDGLPIGLQLVGRPFDEVRLLRLARAYEQASGHGELRPPLGDFSH
jgi:aspartyl-tRNA(Asn)/glutamyl-tRNA(Gln) amidotransferase subunit A